RWHPPRRQHRGRTTGRRSHRISRDPRTGGAAGTHTRALLPHGLPRLTGDGTAAGATLPDGHRTVVLETVGHRTVVLQSVGLQTEPRRGRCDPAVEQLCTVEPDLRAELSEDLRTHGADQRRPRPDRL